MSAMLFKLDIFHRIKNDIAKYMLIQISLEH